jgi:radical SAM protein with 4Fe4S-binding SPASM domain
MYKQLKSPIAVQLELTTACNHKCIHCYNHWRKASEKDVTLSEEDARKIVKNLADSEVPNFLITGGEPMMHTDLMMSTFEFAKSLGLKCSLNSNLTLMTPEVARELKRLDIGVLTSILSYDKNTHDNITTVRGSFGRLIEGIEILREFEVPVSANMVVMQPNFDQIHETGKFVHSLGVTGFRATKVHPAQGSTNFEQIRLPAEKIAGIFDNLIELRDEFGLKVDSLTTYPVCLLKDMSRYGQFLSKRSCSAGKTGCTIGSDGQVRPCGHSDDVYGNAIEESLLQIWPRLKSWRDGSLLPQECKECKYVIECSGGCRMDCKYYGNICSMDPYATSKDFAYVPRKPNDVVLLDPNKDLIVNSGLHLRSEEFGTALIVDGTFKSIVNADSIELLKELRGKTFTLDYVSKEYNIELGLVRNFFTGLYSQNVICLAT